MRREGLVGLSFSDEGMTLLGWTRVFWVEIFVCVV